MKPVWVRKGNGYVRIPDNVLTELADGRYALLTATEAVSPLSCYHENIQFLNEHKEHFSLLGSHQGIEVWVLRQHKHIKR